MLTKQLDQCIDNIRCLPGQAHFLRPPSSDQIKKMAQDGTIVVANMSDIRVANRPRFGCYSQVRILQLCPTQLKGLS
jgi:hypothetical protein